MTDRLQLIINTLQTALNPRLLEVTDESEQHHGHVGALSDKGHFAVKIASDAFKNKSLVECHRLIYGALSDLMQTEIHALRIKIVS